MTRCLSSGKRSRILARIPFPTNPVPPRRRIVLSLNARIASAIRAFSDKTILLLGGTGFVGKGILANILDRFPELRHLVIQARRKKNLSGEERFYAETLQAPPLKFVVDRIGGESVV